MKKKLLVLSPYFPYPPRDGGKVRLYNLLRQLSRTNEIVLLSYIESGHMNEYVPALEEFGIKVFTVIRDESKGIVNDQLPRSISFFYTPEMIEKLENVLEAERPDLVQIDFLIMTQYANHVRGIPVVYTEHDMSNISFEQSFHDRDLPERMRFVEWSKLVRFEREMLPKFRSVIVLTERDRQLLDNFVPGLTTLLAPTGADTHYFQPSYTSRDTLSMLFIGHYGHYPNYDAVFHFCRDILPRIVSVLPAAYFQVVGSGTKKDLAGLSDDHIHVIGEVDDVRRYLNAASIFVAPVRLGGGIKGKILEAMASGLAVVATREASGGINGRPAIEIEVADNETDFANKVVALLRSPERCQQLARNARALVEEQYDWTAIAARIDAHYDSIIKRSS